MGQVFSSGDLWRIFIPTRDSSRYISVFYNHYRAFGLNPLYIVDSRSADNTYELLCAMGAEVHLINPSGAFGVTELIQAACEVSGAKWVIRLDDDEFPSTQMLSFIDRYVSNNIEGTKEKVSFSRQWLKIIDGDYVFFKSRARDFRPHYDGQFRLFSNRGLSFEHNIHTSGISTEGLTEVLAPADCFIVHFDAILKSTDEKLHKMRRYEKIETGSAWPMSDLYLTEIFSDRDTYTHHTTDLEQFNSLIHELPKFASAKLPNLTEDEIHNIMTKCVVPGLRISSRINRDKIIEKIWHGQDPFLHFPKNLFSHDIQGWRSVHPYLLDTIDEIRPNIIVEIGVWKGGSVISMASRLKELSVSGVIIAVDTWLGAVDHWATRDVFDQLSFDKGYPNLFYKFCNNIITSDLTEYVVPLPLDSVNASELLKLSDIPIDMIHLDAGHEYNSVMADLKAWWPRLRSGGNFIGDDYDPDGGTYPGVLTAFNEFFQALDISDIAYSNGKCIIRKP